MEPPNTSDERFKNKHKKQLKNPETRNLEKSVFSSKEPVYTCPPTPFYRETKRLLHSDIALESKEYSK
jgi:hypothetical protein